MGYDIPYIRNIKGSDTNELICETETDSETRSMNSWLVRAGETCGEGIFRAFGMNMNTLLDLKRITDKDLL